MIKTFYNSDKFRHTEFLYVVTYYVVSYDRFLYTDPLTTLAGYNHTTHNSAGGDSTSRPRRQGEIKYF
jgi:hypothetical protein